MPSHACTVLLVEDDPLLRDASVFVLEADGYTVVTAASGLSALSTLQEHPDVDVMLSDVGLTGGMDGNELAARVHDLRPDVRVVLSSGAWGGSRSRRDADAVYLSKPYDRRSLIDALETARHQPGGHRASSS